MKVALLARSHLFSQRGGDTVQVEMTADALQNCGVDVAIYTNQYAVPLNEIDLLHFFNLGRPEGIMGILNSISVPLIISSIYVDYTAYEQYSAKGMRKLLTKTLNKHQLEYAKVVARMAKGSSEKIPGEYLRSGQQSSISKLLQRSGALITSTQHEMDRIAREFALPKNSFSIPLGVQPVFTARQNQVERQKAVLAVGRIEGLKNQLRVIRVCKSNDWPLTIVGESAKNHQGYWKQCIEEGGDLVHFTGALGQEHLRQQYEKHQVHAIPSFFETFHLASLEALVCGCRPVMGSGTDAEEIYGDSVLYADPLSEKSIESAIAKAFSQPVTDDERNRFIEKHNWNNIGQQVKRVYEKVLTK